MANMIVGYLVLGILGLLGLPLARIRDILVGFLQRMLHVAYFAILSVFAFFGIRPEMAPEQLTQLLQPMTSWLVGWLPAGVATESPGMVWILNGVAFAVPSVPVLLLAYFLKQVTHDTRQRKEKRKRDIGGAAGGTSRRGDTPADEAVDNAMPVGTAEM
jgi:hypothetical protein